ncbi:MAG: PAS domain S-box protein [Magnetococcus sp. YQC-9]
MVTSETQRTIVPSARLSLRQRLIYRQARMALAVGALVGVVLGLGVVVFDLVRERDRTRDALYRTLTIVSEPAAHAVSGQDRLLAKRLLTGLLLESAIWQVELRLPDDTLLARSQTGEAERVFDRWMTGLLWPGESTLEWPVSSTGGAVGKLVVQINLRVRATNFLLRALFMLLIELVQAIILSVLLTLVFHRLLTRPIRQIGRQLAQVDPTRPIHLPITVPLEHVDNELGLLARHINHALTLFDHALLSRKETDWLLQRTQFSVDHAADMICWVDSEGRFIYVNEAMCQALGYTRAELLERSIYEIRSDMTPELWEEHRADLEEWGKSCMEVAVRTKGGEPLDLEVQTTLLKIEGMSIHCHFARDMRPRKLAERTIRRANRTLLTLSHGNETMIKATSEQELLKRICRLIVEDGGYRMAWVGFATSDGRIVPAAQYGFDDGYLDTLQISWQDAKTGRGPTGTAYRTGRPTLAREIQSDPHFTPWREEATRRGYVSSLALPLPVDDLLPLGTLNIYSGALDAFDSEEIQLLENLANNLAFGILKFREAEERRRAQKALQISEEKLRTLIQHSPDHLMTLDRNGHVRFSNRAGGSDCLSDALFKERLPDLKARIAEVFATGEAVEFPFTDGESSWWEARVAPIFHDGRVSEVLAVCQDVTEKHTLQAQNLRNARLASLGVLSASVAHEVNNPNNAIQFNVPVLSAVWEDARPILQGVHQGSGAFYLGGMEFEEAMEVVPRLLEGIQMSSQRIKIIIDGLKHMVRQDKGIVTQRINILDPIHAAMMILQNQIRAATNSCRLLPPLQPVMVRGNAQQLEQAFINILQNGLHALTCREEGIFIAIQADPEAGFLEVRFRDEGRGIALENLGKLTDPFFSTKTESGGMGLGLSITKSIIENHAGELIFASEPGLGTTVTVRLPLDATTLRGETA